MLLKSFVHFFNVTDLTDEEEMKYSNVIEVKER
jgi:hypothetical protein